MSDTERASSGPHEQNPLLDLVRGGAALIVFLSHGLGLTFGLSERYEALGWPGYLLRVLNSFPYLAHQSVIVFFVLSGYLVGGKLLTYRRGTRDEIVDYAIDRGVRIYSIAVPALILSVLVADLVALSRSSYPFAAEFSGICKPSLSTLLGNLLVLNKILVPTICSDIPYWSIQNEVSYYVVAAAVYFAVLRLRRGALAWPLLMAAIVAVAFLSLEPINDRNTLLLSGTWLLGMACAKGTTVRQVTMICFGYAMYAALTIAVYSSSTLKVDLVIAALSATLILFSRLDAVGHLFGWRMLVRLARYLSSKSYTLYLFHFPLQFLLWSVFIYPATDDHVLNAGDGTAWIVFLAIAGLSFLGAMLIPVERYTYSLRNAVKKRIRYPVRVPR